MGKPLGQFLNPWASVDLDKLIELASGKLVVWRVTVRSDGLQIVRILCPWKPLDHVDGSAEIRRLPDGKMWARCFHNGCKGRDWFSVLDHVIPGWRQDRSLLDNLR